MNIFKRIKRLFDIEKRYEKLSNEYDKIVITVSSQALRIGELESELEHGRKCVRDNVELINKKEKTIADMNKKLNKAHKEIKHLETTIEKIKNPRI